MIEFFAQIGLAAIGIYFSCVVGFMAFSFLAVALGFIFLIPYTIGMYIYDQLCASAPDNLKRFSRRFLG